ncbi:MAG: hypothetical protein ACFFBP_23055 [Promethearchaeota archaeon]
MEREIIDKCLKYFSILIFITSLVELILAIIISLIPIIVNSEVIPLINFILSDSFQIAGSVSWILTIITPLFTLILGLFLYFIITKKQISIEYLSKYMMVFGLIIMIGTFIKLEYQYILQKVSVVIGTDTKQFLLVLIDPSITPFSVLVLWTIQTSIYCGYTVLAIVITAGGLNKSLKIEKDQESRS